jgi:hypothetical protein
MIHLHIFFSTGVPGDDSYPSDESEIEDEADEDSNGLVYTFPANKLLSAV